MTARHTPGPWTVKRGGTTDALYIAAPTGIVAVWEASRVDEQTKRDAALMAAAPDLLAVLREIVGQEKPNSWGYDAASVAMNDDWRARARAALAAAGRAP